ncbi:uncharacterized protein [Asterias amurensis]|uniref:uncharacterized protein n=1 Tax=Asterias amurensis TaxID=7602 RepID=UPI003AB1406A
MEFVTPRSSRMDDEDHEDCLENDDCPQQLAHQAAATGKVSLLMEAVNHDPSALESQDEKGMTPLSRAVISKQLDMVKLLVKMGADINTRDSLGRTPLCLAAYEGWHHGVVYLLRSGGKQAIADRSGRLPLHAATYDKDSRSLSALLQTLTIGDVNEPDNDGMTALHWAAFHNRPEHVQLLMLRGADLYCVDVDGKTPLHWASQNGCLACCSIMAKCRSGGAPLIDMIEGSGKSCVHLAAAAGFSNILEEYADVPAVDFEALDPNDRTPLHWGAVSGKLECVQMLLQLGVDPSPHDVNGGTPLDYAKQAAKPEVMRILQRAGAEFGTMVLSKSSQEMGRIGEGEKPRKKRFGFLTDWFSRRKNGLSYKSPSEESEDPNSAKERTGVAMATFDQSNYATGHKEPDCDCRPDAGSLEEDVSDGCLHPGFRTRKGPSDTLADQSLNDHPDTGSNKRSMSEDLVYIRRNSFPTSGESDLLEKSPRRGSASVIRATSPMYVDGVHADETFVSSRLGASPVPMPIATKGSSHWNDDAGSLGEVTVMLKPLCRELPDADTVQRQAQEILDAQRSENWISTGSGASLKSMPSLCGRSLSHKNLYVSSVPKLAPLTTRPPVSPGTDPLLVLTHRNTAPSPSALIHAHCAPANLSTYHLSTKERTSENQYGSCPTINHKGLPNSKGSNVRSSRLEALKPIQSQSAEKSEKKKKKKKLKPLSLVTTKLPDSDSFDLTLSAPADSSKADIFCQSLPLKVDASSADPVTKS